MDSCRALFRYAAAFTNLKDAEIPYPEGVWQPPPRFGRALPMQLLYGIERQFHLHRTAILSRLFRCLCGERDPARLRQAGLLDLMANFFRRNGPQRDYPALLWFSPIWPRSANWIKQRQMEAEDETHTIEDHSLASDGRTTHPLLFPSGHEISVPVRQLRFHHENRSCRNLLIVPRTRNLRTSAGLSAGFEVGFGKGDWREKELLEADGSYSPNEPFHVEQDGWRYLDLYTVTLARVHPFPPGDASDRLFRSDVFAGGELPSAFDLIRGERLPVSGFVEFFRLTFVPDTMEILVLLAPERQFGRFVAEHAGLADLLASALVERESI